jgi:hypothetical protein
VVTTETPITGMLCIQNVPWLGFVIGCADQPNPERFALEDFFLDRGFALACRSRRTGDFLCGDCASIEQCENDGVLHDLLALEEQEEGPWHCDFCGSPDFE